jgi:hypothetical protein
VKHYDENWHYVNADMFYGINWHNFNTMDLDMVNSYLGIVDGRIPIKDLNTISLQTDIIIDDNNKDVEQTFTYDDKLICRNEMELLHNGICLKVNSEVS